jgi:hypothetical protein
MSKTIGNGARRVARRSIGLAAAILALAAMATGVAAKTVRVDFEGRKADLIDALAAYDSDSCHSLTTDVSVKTQPKNGRLSVQAVTITADEGSCKGRKIRVFAIVYQPPRFQGQGRGRDQLPLAAASLSGKPEHATAVEQIYHHREIAARRA